MEYWSVEPNQPITPLLRYPYPDVAQLEVLLAVGDEHLSRRIGDTQEGREGGNPDLRARDDHPVVAGDDVLHVEPPRFVRDGGRADPPQPERPDGSDSDRRAESLAHRHRRQQPDPDARGG